MTFFSLNDNILLYGKNRSETTMEEEKIVINKNGKDIECDVLFTFDSS